MSPHQSVCAARESFKWPYLAMYALTARPVLWLCHSVLPAERPPSQPNWLQAIGSLASTFTPELKSKITHTKRSSAVNINQSRVYCGGREMTKVEVYTIKPAVTYLQM